MKSIKIFVILTLLSLSAIPALAALTDYQQGVMNGLQAGMLLGKLLGAAPFDPSLAQQYNSQVDAFNQGLATVFGNNQTAINKFWLKPYGAAAAAAATITGKPVHAIDGSWNNTSRVLGDQDEGKRIYDMPASSYYTWTGNAPSLPYTKARDANGNLINYDSMGTI
jgi:hypothetical protein